MWRVGAESYYIYLSLFSGHLARPLLLKGQAGIWCLRSQQLDSESPDAAVFAYVSGFFAFGGGETLLETLTNFWDKMAIGWPVADNQKSIRMRLEMR